MTYDSLFQTATGNAEPYAYQRRLAGDTEGQACASQLISIPTGLGKTAAVVLAWLWNRVAHHDAPHRATWPRRLVYCLPMRTLVEQTAKDARKWIETLHAAGHLPVKPHVIILMGGEALEGLDKDWDLHPERKAILIGTQDMLLSRALNRGYGLSRYRWPMHFGLLNNDCLWVMDETQLMGVSVETSAQLDGWRATWPVFGRCPTWWMSATLDEARFTTVDAQPGARPRLTLPDDECASGRPAELYRAKKTLAPCKLVLSPATKADYAKHIAKHIVDRHQPDTLTLVVVNRVARAQEVYAALTAPGKKKQPSLYDPARVALVHSRFRRADRAKHEQLLFGSGDRIVVATQAVEAGVDVSARLLVTELAPWSSLVQRIGRCNRRAEFSDAEILWVDIEPDAKGELLLPYSQDELARARAAIIPLTDASSQTLGAVKVAAPKVVRPVIRRRDLVDLFDTTPDLCGQDLDISRYIRDEQDNDVQFFWRAVGDQGPAPDEKPPHRDELCRVSIGSAKDFLKAKTTRAWRWNPLDEKWEEAKSARPGAVYLLAATSGGYSAAYGWTGDSGDQPAPLPPADGENERYCGDRRSFSRTWQPLAEHTAQVVAEMDQLATALALPATEAATFRTAAQWHDVGKAHADFQAMLRAGGPPPRNGELWAKSANQEGRGTHRHLRHELASALAWLLASPADAPERDLIAYLIAAHHGKVRLSIRSLPEEKGDPRDPDRLFARGVWHGEKLPALMLGELTVPETTLDLRFMHMGESELGPSWLARTLALRDRLGPFRLAFLETLLRAADARASVQPRP